MATNPGRSFRPVLETLEDRCLLSGFMRFRTPVFRQPLISGATHFQSFVAYSPFKTGGLPGTGIETTGLSGRGLSVPGLFNPGLASTGTTGTGSGGTSNVNLPGFPPGSLDPFFLATPVGTPSGTAISQTVFFVLPSGSILFIP
jgi:hypothetical protein